MRPFEHHPLLPALAFGILIAISVSPSCGLGAVVLWEASSGVLPDSTCPAWIPAVGDSTPQFFSGAMRIKTTECSRSISYRQVAPDFLAPDTLIVEARVRYATGTECTGPCGHYRQAAQIAITVAPQVGVLFFIGNDEIFITNSECGSTTSVAVDTNNQAHTYRILIFGGGAVSVLYDGAPVLSGHTYTSASDHGSLPRVLWGEGSFLAFGTSYWEYLWHNGHTSGCQTTSAETPETAGASDPAMAVRAVPNPFEFTTTLRFGLQRAGRVQADLFSVSGRFVRHLLDAECGPGWHEVHWNGLDQTGRQVPPGLYLVKIAAPDGERRAKLMRLRR